MALSALAADHIARPRNRGPIEDGRYGVAGIPGDGPYVEIWVSVSSGVIQNAGFRTPGCPSSTAAASVLCELAIGREIARVRELTATELLTVLGGLPEGKGMYAEMSIQALNIALKGVACA